MYHIVFLLLFFFSFVEIFSRKKMKMQSSIIFLFLFLMVTLRYGQGTDYFAYNHSFVTSANAFESALRLNNFSSLTKEIGFSAISYIWIKILHFSPESLNALFSAVSFYLVWLFIKKYSPKPIMSLFIFYSTFYLVYPFSGIRQAVCISIFIYYQIPMLHKKKYLEYFLLCILLFMIHYSSIVLFIIPIVNMIYKLKPLQIYIISIAALLVGVSLYYVLYSLFSSIDIIAGKVDSYSQENSLNIMSLLLKIIIFIPIMQTRKLYESDSIKYLFLKIYILGFILYLVLIGSSLISSRISVFMRYLEIILLVDFLLFVFKRRLNKVLSYSYIFLIMTTVYVKNIDAYIGQGSYYSHINFYNYPYINVFNKKKINEARYILPQFQKYVDYE